MGHPRAIGLLLISALLVVVLLASLRASATTPPPEGPELSWSAEPGWLQVGPWSFDADDLWFAASVGDDDHSASMMTPRSKYGRSESQRVGTASYGGDTVTLIPPDDAVAEPGGQRTAWIEQRCVDWDTRWVRETHLCVHDPGGGDPRICYDVPRHRTLAELHESHAADPEQLERMLDHMFRREQPVHILSHGLGEPACVTKILGNPGVSGAGSYHASVYTEERDEQGCLWHRSVSLDLGPCQHGSCAGTYSGPGGFEECPDGTSRGWGVGEFWSASADYATDEFVAMGGERWFLDGAACERALAGELTIDWATCTPSSSAASP